LAVTFWVPTTTKTTEALFTCRISFTRAVPTETTWSALFASTVPGEVTVRSITSANSFVV